MLSFGFVNGHLWIDGHLFIYWREKKAVMNLTLYVKKECQTMMKAEECFKLNIMIKQRWWYQSEKIVKKYDLSEDFRQRRMYPPKYRNKTSTDEDI